MTSKRKGESGERELVELLHAAGWPEARRNFASGARGGGDITGLPGYHIECKRQERITILDWCRQAEAEALTTFAPVVAFRPSREPWRAVMLLDDLLPILKLRESA